MSLIDKARQLFQAASSVCVLTGAGISAESGLNTFRDGDGLWDNHRIEDVATPAGFAADPERVWRFYNERREAAHKAAPNPAHRALAQLEAAKPRARAVTVLTQNIDGLHQQAGSRNVVELHGSLWKLECTSCGRIVEDFPVRVPVLPHCPGCRRLLRPHVVWFGEALAPEVLAAANAAVMSCDLFLVVGTSAVVQPAASYPFVASRRHVPVIEVNKEHTPVSAIADVILLGRAGEILPGVVPG